MLTGFLITGTILLIKYLKNKVNKGIQQSTVDFIEKLEGRKPTIYKDIAGNDTVGVGHLVVMPQDANLYDSQPLTEKQIDLLLFDDLKPFADEISKKITVPLNQNQFDALMALEFNIGKYGFDSSTLVKDINAKASKEEITNAWMAWNHIKGTVSDALTERRKKEIDLFFSTL